MTPATRSLLRAAATGDVGLIRAMLAQGTEVNCVTAAGQTPLMLAAGFNHEAAVKLLLTAGAFLDAQDELGLTAIDWAANSPAIRTLITEAMKAPESRTIESVPQYWAQQNEETFASESPEPVSGATPIQPVSEVTPIHQSQFVARTPVGALDNSAASRVTLGGLAGAILRERAAKTAPSPGVNPEFAPLPVPPATIADAPVESGTESLVPSPIAEVNAADSSYENPQTAELASRFEANDDHPTRELIETSFDTSPTITTELSNQKAAATTHSRDDASANLKPLSKVQVEVPSFKSMPSSNRRPMLWVLIIFLLAGAAFASFQLSRYLLSRRTGDIQAAASDARNQAKIAPVKSAPIVGGDLTGTDLFVPDADYPASSQTSDVGNVIVLVKVNQRGIVVSSKATEGPESLRAAAENASKRAAFSPAKLRDKGRVVTGTITYSFVPPNVAQSNQIPSTAPISDFSQAGGPQKSGEGGNSPSVGGPLFGAAIKLPPAAYPASAKSQGIVGTVTVVVRVNKAGKVVSWRSLDGDNRLRAAAIRAARQATFSPEKLPGNEDVVGTITYTFGLH